LRNRRCSRYSIASGDGRAGLKRFLKPACCRSQLFQIALFFRLLSFSEDGAVHLKMIFKKFSHKARIAALSIFVLLVPCSVSLQPKPARFTFAPVAPIIEMENEPTSETSDDPDSRGDWFAFQRSYPDNSMPSDARVKAWAAVSRMKLETSFKALAAKNWRSIGPSPSNPAFSNWGLVSGRINAIAVSPSNPSIALAGSATGGIWRSSDGGASFDPVSDDQADLAVGSLAFSKSNPSIVYAGMGDTKLGYLGSGVLRSTDAGKSWTRVSNNTLPSPGTISKIEVDPSNSNRVFAAQYSRLADNKITSSGLYLSTDGAVNWSKKLGGAPRDISIDPSKPQTIYVGLMSIETETDPAAGLYRSTDGGGAWSEVFTFDYDVKKRRDIKVAISPLNPQTIYAYYGGVSGNFFQAQLRVSSDGGITWTDKGASGFDTAQFGYNTYLAVDLKDERVIYVGSRDVFRSEDGGSSWTNLTQSFTFDGAGYSYTPGIAKAHPDQHAFALVPGAPNQFYIGNDGGIYKTIDGGNSFQSLNSTLSLTQFTSIALHPTNPNISYGGTQDNGAQRRFAELGRWFEVATGDGGRVVINPLNPSVAFLTYIRGVIYRFADNGRYIEAQVAWDDTFGETFAVPRIGFYPPFVGNGVDSTLYFGTWRLFVSNNLGDTWFAPGGDLDLTKGITEKAPDVLSAIGVGRANTNVIYTGSAQGRAMLTTDGGATWKDITSGLPDRSITKIAVDPADSTIAFMTLSGFNSGHIFKTTDMGATWRDISGNLPNIPTNSILIDPLNANTLYAATDVGVFRSKSGGSNWQPFNDGMPPVIVQDFAAQSDGLIQVATYGRGAFEIIGNARPAIAAAEWDGKKKLRIQGAAFGDEPRVLINGTDRTKFLTSASDSSLTVKKNAKKLGLQTGDNTIQVVNSNDVASATFLLKL
jgi:photosystem II stability/assembly factor-like uncharacterized protein